MIQKSGAIILNEGHNSVLLLYRAKQKDWTFPKGHIEEGETAERALLKSMQRN